jgi:hypothetical protein
MNYIPKPGIRLLLSVIFLAAAVFEAQHAAAQQMQFNDTLPVRGLAIGAPRPADVDSFVLFIRKELAPRQVNTLILRVDFGYQYKSHPELVDEGALSTADIKKLVAATKQSGIRIIPQINLLGHQSWANETGKLLTVYPQFDETPWVKMPEKYEWPNADGLYCKSYCPLHPDVHKIVFELVDELCDAFETDAFHAGMDEVFYLAEKKCPRCGGKDPAELFAAELTKIRNHLATKNRQLWIWGDRLLDGKTTGLGQWEASYNNTHRAIDMIPKDVMICDWHYERADQSAVYFAMKGFPVVTCPWRNPQTAVWQVEDMYKFRQRATRAAKDRYKGIVQTVWSSSNAFLREFYGPATPPDTKTAANAFKAVFPMPPRR